MSSTQAGFFDNLVAAVRENPVAAALIGGGAFWLLVGDEKLKSAAHSVTAATSPVVDNGTRTLQAAASSIKRTTAPPTAPELDHEAAFGAGETLRDAGSAASDAMSAAANKATVSARRRPRLCAGELRQTRQSASWKGGFYQSAIVARQHI